MKTMTTEMFLRGFTARWGKKTPRCSVVLEGTWPGEDLPAQWDEMKGRPIAALRILDESGGVLFLDSLPDCTVNERGITVRLRIDWLCYLSPMLRTEDQKDEHRARVAQVSGDGSLLSILFAGQALGDPVRCEIDWREQEKAAPVLPFSPKDLVQRAIEELRPKPGSGIDSVRLESGGKSVTLNADGTSEHKEESHD